MITKINSVSLLPQNINNTRPSLRRQSFGSTAIAENFYEVKPNEIKIPNLLELNDGVSEVKVSDLSENQAKVVFSNGDKNLRIEKRNYGVNTIISIRATDKDNYSKVIGKISVSNNAYAPILTYQQGKFKPEITVKHRNLESTKIKMLAGSELITPEFTIKMPGSYTDRNNNKQVISFTGNNKTALYVTTMHMEENTQNAINLFLKAQLAGKVTPGAYVKDVKMYNPNAVMPAGGQGQRYANISGEEENKPSTPLPTNDAYRVMGSALSMFSAMGKIDKHTKSPQITYISQTHQIDNTKDGSTVVNAQQYKNDGGAIAEALDKGFIDNSKDTVILNADIFTNADITRAYHALKTLPNAALVIPYYPVNAERAKSFGLIGLGNSVAANDDANLGIGLELKQFIEKPKYTNIAPERPSINNFTEEEYILAKEQFEKDIQSYYKTQLAKLPNGNYAANPGMYVLSKEATAELKKLYQGDKAKLGLGANVMPHIVELCNSGQLKNDKGEPMKAYTVPLQRPDGQAAFWDDIGSAEAFLKVVKDVARETKRKGTGKTNNFYGVPEFVLKYFAKNTDLESGIVYQSSAAKDNFNTFKKAVDAKSVRGNIYVAG